jgi:type I restriction enzyme S subunit
MRKMKHSDIEWIGDIPSDWEVKRFKYLVIDIKSGDSLTNETLSDDDMFYPVFGGGKQIGYYGKSNVTSNNLLIGRVGANCGCVTKITGKAWATDNALIVHSHDNIKYLYYLLLVTNLNNISDANAQPLITASKVLNTRIPFCVNIQEQYAIVDFLDIQCEKIDTIIAIEETIISELNEYKKSIIQKATTKGISKTKMKNSGIDWVGEIPEGWEVKKLKYCADIVLGKMLCNEDKGGYYKKPYLKSKNIQWLNIDVSGIEEMWFSEYELELYRLKKGDLVLSEGGEVGKTCMWNDELEECYIQNSAHKVTINQNNLNTFFLYLFHAYGSAGGFNSIVRTISIAHLTKDKLLNLQCVVPSLPEQKTIAAYLGKKTGEVDKLISIKQKKITQLKEYKKSLIYEYVTGKKEVPA